MVGPVIAGFGVWLLGCGYAGYKIRFLAFACLVVVGIALITVYIIYGLYQAPLSPHAIMAQSAALMLSVSAFGMGWLLGRLVKRFRDSAVDAT
ncbi:MAG: hypothetical protein WBG95_07900 [Sulfitobacter sp.]